jgi:hypothetical protein
MKPGCPSFTGWPEEGLSYCDREVGLDGTHEGMHSYPHVHAPLSPQSEEEIMEDTEEDHRSLRSEIKITEQLVADIRKTLGEIRPVVPAKRKRERRSKSPPPLAPRLSWSRRSPP